MATKLDPYSEGFLKMCYQAGLSEAQAVVALVKSSARKLAQDGTPLDVVSRRVFYDQSLRTILPRFHPAAQ